MYQNVFANLNSKKQNKPSGTNATLSCHLDQSLLLEQARNETDQISLSGALSTLDILSGLVSLASDEKENGLSRDGLNLYHNQATALLDTLGVPSETIVPSMESFNDSQQANIQNFEFSLAGLGDTLVAAYEAVIKFIKDMIAKGKAFFAKLMDKAPKLKEQAEKLKEKAGEVEGSPEEKKIKIGSSVTHLADDSKRSINVKEITDGLNAMLSTTVGDELVSLATAEAFDKLDADADDIAKLKPSDLDITTDKLKAALSKAGGNTDKPEGFGLSAEHKAWSLSLPGNTSLVASYKENPDANADTPDALAAALKQYASVSFGAKPRVKKFEVDKDLEVTTLSTSDVESICDSVIEFAETYEKETKTIRSAQKKSDDLVKVADKLKTSAGKTDYKAVKAQMNAARSALMSASSMALDPSRAITASGFTLASAGLVYCDKSLAQYTDK